MENNGEYITGKIENGDSIKECEGYDFNQTYVKSESNEIESQAAPMKINGMIEDSELHKCNICSKSFKNEKLIKVHMKRHTRPFKCQFCTLSFSKTGNLKAHIKNHRPFANNDHHGIQESV